MASRNRPHAPSCRVAALSSVSADARRGLEGGRRKKETSRPGRIPPSTEPTGARPRRRADKKPLSSPVAPRPGKTAAVVITHGARAVAHGGRAGTPGARAVANGGRAGTPGAGAVAHGRRAGTHGARAGTHGARAVAHGARAVAHGVRGVIYRARVVTSAAAVEFGASSTALPATANHPRRPWPEAGGMLLCAGDRILTSQLLPKPCGHWTMHQPRRRPRW